MAKLFIHCDEATELIERKQAKALNWRDRLRLSIHLIMCRLCRVYKQQSQRLDRFLNNHRKKTELEVTPLSPEEAEKLKKKIKEKLDLK